jgi:phosphatidylinositol glycan class B
MNHLGRVFAVLAAAAIDTYHLRAQKGDSSLSLSIINFISVNSSAVSQFYGRMPWHYYLTQAMPLLCTSSLPFVIKGLSNVFNGGDKVLRLLAYLVAWTTSVYSAISHKEWRFLHPLLPVMHVFAAKSMIDACSSRKVGKSSRRWFGLGGIYLILPLLTLPLSIYVIRYHGRGQIAVMEYLRSISRQELHSVGFLMPCHSTPMQSHLHRPHLDEGRLWAIGCEPPLRPTIDMKNGRGVLGTGPNMVNAYKDQSDVFYDAPLHYLESFFPQQVDPAFPPSPMPKTPPGEISSTWEGFRSWNHTWPSHLVFFGALRRSPGVEKLLEQQGYIVSWKTGNGFEEDVRRRGGVEVWRWSSSHIPQLN